MSTTSSEQPHCNVTVTVSGERGSGKSYLIAVLAQALRGAGHQADTPKHIPTAIQAIADLSRPYRVTFAEVSESEVTQTGDAQPADAAITEIDTLRAEVAALKTETFTLKAAASSRHIQLQELVTRNAYLEEQVRAGVTNGLSQAEISRLIQRALTYARDSAKIEQARQDTLRRAEDLKATSNKMRDESEARQREAEAMLYQVFTGQRPAPLTPAQIQVARREAGRQLSASDKLALANGASPDIQVAGEPVAQNNDATPVGARVAAARAVAEIVTEANLASTIENALNGEAQ